MSNNYQKIKSYFQNPIIIGIIFLVLFGGVGYGFAQYQEISESINNSKELADNKNFNEAIEKLETTQENFLVDVLEIKKKKINNKIKKYKKKSDSKTKFKKGISEFNNENWQEAIETLSKVSSKSSYSVQAELKIQEAQENIEKQQELESRGQTSQEKISKKADNYVVDHTKSGKALTWSDLEAIANIIEQEKLPANRRKLEKIKTNKKRLNDLIKSTNDFLSEYPEDEQMNTMLRKVKAERLAARKTISSLNDWFNVTEGLIEAIRNRDEDLYLYYSSRKKELKEKSNNLLEDYREIHKNTQDYVQQKLSE